MELASSAEIRVPQFVSEMSENSIRIFCQEHALQNNLVVQNIFKYLEKSADLTTLKNIRLVCPVWCNESLSWWRKTATITVIPDAKPQLVGSSLVTTFGKLLGQMQDSPGFYRLADKPCLNFSLKNTTVDVKYILSQKSPVTNFWRFVGPHIKHFVISNVTFYNQERKWNSKSKQHFICLLHGLMPNLESLVLEHISFRTLDFFNHDLVHSKSFLKYQLPNVVYLKVKREPYLTTKSLPKLEHLVLENCHFPELYNILDPGLKHPETQNTTIKRIDLMLSQVPRCVGILHFTHCRIVNLRHFTVDLLCVRPVFRNSSNGMKYFLNTHRESLEVLEVLDFPFLDQYCGPLFQTPFDKLTELRLWGNVLTNFSILKFTPNLKILHMDLFGLEKQEELRKESNRWFDKRNPISGIKVDEIVNCDLPAAVVPKLEYLQINCMLSLDNLKKLGVWMPNLKTLKAILSSGSISLISQQWPLLEELVGLAGSRIQDEDVVITAEPCLHDLKNLKTFHLKSCCGEGLLTDIAAELGFLQMAQLKDLRICVSPQFSEEMERRLSENIPMVHIKRNYTGNKEHMNWECCRELDFVHYFRDKLTNMVWDPNSNV